MFSIVIKLIITVSCLITVLDLYVEIFLSLSVYSNFQHLLLFAFLTASRLSKTLTNLEESQPKSKQQQLLKSSLSSSSNNNTSNNQLVNETTEQIKRLQNQKSIALDVVQACLFRMTALLVMHKSQNHDPMMNKTNLTGQDLIVGDADDNNDEEEEECQEEEDNDEYDGDSDDDDDSDDNDDDDDLDGDEDNEDEDRSSERQKRHYPHRRKFHHHLQYGGSVMKRLLLKPKRSVSRLNNPNTTNFPVPPVTTTTMTVSTTGNPNSSCHLINDTKNPTTIDITSTTITSSRKKLYVMKGDTARRLLQEICHSPLRLFTTEMLENALACWQWLIVGRPELTIQVRINETIFFLIFKEFSQYPHEM